MSAVLLGCATPTPMKFESGSTVKQEEFPLHRYQCQQDARVAEQSQMNDSAALSLPHPH